MAKSYFYPLGTPADEWKQGNMAMMSELWKNSPVFVSESSLGEFVRRLPCANMHVLIVMPSSDTSCKNSTYLTD